MDGGSYIVQEELIKTIPKKKKYKKAKWVPEEALQIVEKRKKVNEVEETGAYYTE